MDVNTTTADYSAELAATAAGRTLNYGMADDADKSPISHSSTSTSTSSAPVYEDDLYNCVALPASLDLLPRQGSVSSTKTCEVDLGEEERDSYSPLSSSHSNSPSDAAVAGICNGSPALPPPGSQSTAIDNKIYDGCLMPQPTSSISNNKINSIAIASTSTPSKEEKQRQNEEIVIMETSSISSETGSWESVFPHAVSGAAAAAGGAPSLPQLAAGSNSSNCSEAQNKTLEMRIYCTEFLQHERQKVEKPKEKEKDRYDRCFRNEVGSVLHLRDPTVSSLKGAEPLRARTFSTGAAGSVTADTSSLFNGGSSSSLLLRSDNPLSTSGTSACFIDASSLRDEDEEVLSFPSLDGQQSVDELDALAKEREEQTPSAVRNGELDSPTQQLETFHKAFAKCKAKTKDTLGAPPNAESNSSSSSSSHSPHKEASTASLTNNLSDEEKLWKREISAATTQSLLPNRCQEVKDHQIEKETKDSHETNVHLFSACQEDATEPSISLAADFDSSDSSEIVKLRREQERRQGTSSFSQPHQQLPKLPFHSTAAHDLSYTTDYSSSSPAPSLIWSEHEHRLNSSGANRLPLQHQLNIEDYDANLHKSCLMIPDTPHNSIAHINDANLSTSSSIHRDYTLSSSCSQQRDSGAYCSDATDSPIPMPRTPKRSKCDEANPIISGGATIEDFGAKKFDSPIVTRRTNTCPIVSGGFRSLDFETTHPQTDEDEEEVELRVKPTTRKPALAMTSSWVVDMSDCRSERRKSTSSSTSSAECAQPARCRERTDSGGSNKSGCDLYASLDHMNKRQDQSENGNRKGSSQMSKSYSGPRSAGFFVNMEEHGTTPTTLMQEESAQNGNTKDTISDKKNIFSMFIDFGEKKISNGGKREPFNLGARLSTSFTSSSSSSTTSHHATTQHQLRRFEDPLRSGASSTETLMSKSSTFKTQPGNDLESMESRSLDYKCNLDKPFGVADLKRISQQQRAQTEASKRHSWGNEGPEDVTAIISTEYKRSISLSAKGGSGDMKETGGGGLMSIIDKLPLISKTSSLSVDSSLSPFEDLTGSKSELSSCSNASGGEEGYNKIVASKIKKRRRDVEINETYDKSSIASLTDGVLSKDLSPSSATDTDDLTFQQDEELATREAVLNSMPPVLAVSSTRSSAVIMETILEAKETSSPKKKSLGHTMETLHATIEKQKQLLETVNEHGVADNHEKCSSTAFVKLSDMDKPVKYDPNSPESMMSKSAGGNHRQMNRLFRDDALKSSHTGSMGAGARPHSWTMMTRSTGNSSFLNITTSVDNLRSLSRIFPNFSKEFSNSVPNDMILDQQMDDYIQTDISADSSLASSFSRSGMDESSISCRQPRRLGEDLLKMFLQEIATDMMVEVSGRRIRAHKCILRSRCQYFAAMLAGNGAVQSVVTLPGYSYSAVHFALCHIYSGASHPPDGISLMELAALADLLGLEGLKEVTAHALKTNYCHNFHKPCSGCIDGILQVLPVALNHALDDLYRKCLRWTCRHYLKVWPTRQFAQLPLDILGRCRQQIMAYLTSETVLDTVLDCDNLLSQLAPFRWGDVCKTIVRDIMDAAYAYIGDHFASLIASDAFLSLGHDKSCHISRLQEMLLRTAANLTADQACRSYQRVTRLNTVLQAKVIKMPANLGELAKELQGLQDEDLDWDPEYVRMVSAILSTVEQCLTRQCSRAMRVTAWQRMDLELRKKIQTLARLTEPIDLKRGSKPVVKAFSFGGHTRTQDLYQVKLAIQAHSKRALAQDTQLYKATQTHEAGFTVQTTERGVQANHEIREGTSKVLKSNSRAHVPSQIYKSAQQSTSLTGGSERRTVNAHRRTQSDAPIAVTTRAAPSQPQPQQGQKQSEAKSVPKARLTEIRPRYLEPRKARSLVSTTNGPIRSATSGSIAATKAKGHHHISSSDSSRNSSPAPRSKAATAVVSKSTKSSVNMSMDSLASPTRRPKHLRSSTGERYSDVESMKSSIISNTNKTNSQESIASATRQLTRSNPQIPLNKNNIATKTTTNNVHNKIFRPTQQTVGSSNHKSNGNILKPQIKTPQKAQQKQLQLHHQNTKLASAGSSPSSVVTTKSTSRLSSVSSTTSARDLYKHRSISVPAGQDKDLTPGNQQRRSFLSAKSREILARRAEKNKQLQQQSLECQSGGSCDEKAHSTGGVPMRSSSLAAVPSAMTAATAAANNRNSLSSNIPTRRPNTLHLKKTFAQVAPTNTNTNQPNKTTTTNIRNKVASSHGYKSAAVVAHAVQQKIELLIDNTVRPSFKARKDASEEESKLERSSTFCKESSDLELNELQIIE